MATKIKATKKILVCKAWRDFRVDISVYGDRVMVIFFF